MLRLLLYHSLTGPEEATGWAGLGCWTVARSVRVQQGRKPLHLALASAARRASSPAVTRLFTMGT